jgi:hypothetical protein
VVDLTTYTVGGVVKPGERTLMTYLLRPLMKRFSTALTEH